MWVLLASICKTNLHDRKIGSFYVITKIVENAYKLDLPPDLAICPSSVQQKDFDLKV